MLILIFWGCPKAQNTSLLVVTALTTTAWCYWKTRRLLLHPADTATAAAVAGLADQNNEILCPVLSSVTVNTNIAVSLIIIIVVVSMHDCGNLEPSAVASTPPNLESKSGSPSPPLPGLRPRFGLISLSREKFCSSPSTAIARLGETFSKGLSTKKYWFFFF